MNIREQCSWCDKKAVLTCPDCGWEACEDHSREDGKCFYCTHIGVVIDQDKVEMMIKFGKGIEKGGKEGRKIIKKAWKEFQKKEV